MPINKITITKIKNIGAKKEVFAEASRLTWQCYQLVESFSHDNFKEFNEKIIGARKYLDDIEALVSAGKEID